MEARRIEVTSLEELTEFLAQEPLGPAAVAYRGIAFDVFERGSADVLQVHSRGVGGHWGHGVHAGLAATAAVGSLLEEHAGIFARVWMPEPLGIDLLVESRPEAAPEETGLLRFYRVDAANPALGVRRLAGPVADVLIRLHTHYHVEMRDERLEFGPLDRPPAELANDLAAVLDAVQSLDTQPHAEMYREEDATICYFCGFTMKPGTGMCPGCGEQIDDD